MSYFIVNIALLIVMTTFLMISKSYFQRRSSRPEDVSENEPDIASPRRTATPGSGTRP
ncbi:MAG: hypothetical protein ABI876_00105 [Bacteroidota bacterium]